MTAVPESPAALLARYTDACEHPDTAGEDELISACNRHDEHRAHTVARLISEPALADRLTRVAARLGQRIGVLGDSISADRLGWAHLLRATAAELTPAAAVLIDARAGRTSSQAIAALPGLLALRPTHVLIMIGVNYTRRYGPAAVRAVSVTETHRNLSALRRMTDEAGVTTSLITPPPTRPVAVIDGEPHWCDTDLDELAGVIRAVDDHAVDVPVAPVAPDAWMSDGVHPSPTGQARLLAAILTALDR